MLLADPAIGEIRGVKDEAVVTYREPLTSLRQGFGPAGNKGDAVSSAFPRVKNVTIELIILEFTFGDFQK